MKKLQLIALTGLILLMGLGAEESSRRETFESGTTDFETFEYIDWFYSDGELQRSEYIFSEDNIVINGRYKQVNYYDESGVEYKYDSFFTEEYESTWGLNRLIEHFEGNEITELVFHFYDGTIASFSGNEITAITRFVTRRLSPDLENFHKEQAKQPGRHFLAGHPFSTLVSLGGNQAEDASEDELQFIDDWFVQRQAEAGAKVYRRRLEVREGEMPAYLFLHEAIDDDIFAQDKIIILGHFLGGIEGMGVTLVVGYLPLEDSW